MQKKQKIYFVYRHSNLRVGSAMMRSHHLRNLIAPFLEERYDLRVVGLPSTSIIARQWGWVARQPRGAVYFFTKNAGRIISCENLIRLHKKSAGICFDYIDGDLMSRPEEGVDIHLCSSFAQLHALRRLQSTAKQSSGTAMLLLHNVDERLYDIKFECLPETRTVYCGGAAHAFLTDQLRSRMAILDAATTENMARIIGSLPNYNLHYAVRHSTQRRGEAYTPFTKGFTAAVCRANILVNRQVDDAIEFLGDDYPYMVQQLDETEIMDMLDHAVAGYGSAEWRTARKIMQSVEARTNPAAIAQQAEAVLRELGV